MDAIEKLLDDRISHLQVSHNALTSQLSLLQSGVDQSFKDYDTRLSSVEAQILLFQSRAIDSQARESIQRVEQQLQLLSISISEGTRGSNKARPSHVHKDARVSEEQSLTVVISNLDDESTEVHCTSWMKKQI